ncbi:MAG: hypothetical protein IH612_03880 [Desulfofustis sp.]|nr:hypothetical protein [Desulfofustis sp.]
MRIQLAGNVGCYRTVLGAQDARPSGQRFREQTKEVADTLNFVLQE